MKYFKLLPLIIGMMFLQGCPGESDEDPDGTFMISNSSGETIYTYFYNSSSEVLPDNFAVKPGISITPSAYYETFFRYDSFDKNRKLWILIFKKSTLDTHTWQEIQNQGLYDKRYALTLEQLKSLNYDIIYDGN